MSAEDRLREILRSEASTVVPAGDGLALIRERVARRRRLLRLLVPAAALLTAAAVVAVFAFSGQPARQELNGPAAPTAPVTAGYPGPMLWPFTSVTQAREWTRELRARPWATSSAAVAAHFFSDLLGIPGVTAKGTGEHVPMVLHGRTIGVVHVVSVFHGGPWTVVGVSGTDLSITTPEVGEAITSPTRVSGRITGVDESVEIRLIPAAGNREIAAAFTPAGTEVPWESSLTWTDQDWFTAGIVAITRSNKDGAINRIAVVVVKRGS